MSNPQPFKALSLLLRRLRARARLSVSEVVNAIGASTSYTKKVLYGEYCPSAGMLGRILRVLRATPEEATEITATADRLRPLDGRQHTGSGGEDSAPRRIARATGRPRSLPVLRVARCSGHCSEHNGQMMPTAPGADGERFENCLRYSECLLDLAKRHPSAERAHCSRTCSKASFVPAAEARAQRIAEATSGGTWDGMTFPAGAPIVRRRKVA